MGCMDGIPPAVEAPKVDTNGDVEMAGPSDEARPQPLTAAKQLNFRCMTCKRLAHYEHLPHPPTLSSDCKLRQIATYYQSKKSWLCADCASFLYPLDKIIAWRPYPANAKEAPGSVPHYKDQLPREYLVKWQDRSYRRLSWVPHMWLVSTNPSKLKNFLSGGTKVELLKEVQQDDASSASATPFEIGAESRGSSAKPTAAYGPLDALPDAERRIIPAWKTVDRVLDVLLWVKEKKKVPKHKRPQRRVESDEEDVEMEDELPRELRAVFEQGEPPLEGWALGPADWEERQGWELSYDDIDKVCWVFTKWGDLGYDEGEPAIVVSVMRKDSYSQLSFMGLSASSGRTRISGV